MKILITEFNVIDIQTDVLVVFYASLPNCLEGTLQAINKNCQNLLTDLIDEKQLPTKKGDLYHFQSRHYMGAKQVLLLCVGETPTLDSIRIGVANSVRKSLSLKAKTVFFKFEPFIFQKLPTLELGQASLEGAILGSFQMNEFKSNSQQTALTSVGFDCPKEAQAIFSNGAKKGQHVGEAQLFARKLANYPSNILTPQKVVEHVKKAFSSSDIKVTVIDDKKAKKLQLNGLINVGKGSIHPPCLIELFYKGSSEKGSTVGLIGKGVTFDSGGISIKGSQGMSAMKGDMSGAAAVIGAMLALSKIKPRNSVKAYIPLAENMPSGGALKPGDVYTAFNGKTIEVTNTDAEGRLLLADALSYAVKSKVDCLVDIATLTGAVIVSLGSEAAAIISNTEEMIELMRSVSDTTGEKVWPLPLYDEYFDLLKSDIADMVNSSETREAGTITAAKFLEQFVDETPWLHIDMAGMMSSKKTKGILNKGMTGYGVRNLVNFVERY